jgi:hypothetical protein
LCLTSRSFARNAIYRPEQGEQIRESLEHAVSATQSPTADDKFLQASGELARLIRDKNWSHTPQAGIRN